MVQKQTRETTTPTQRADARLDVELRKLDKLAARIRKARQQVTDLEGERTSVAASAEYAAANPSLSPQAKQRYEDALATPEVEGGQPEETDAESVG